MKNIVALGKSSSIDSKKFLENSKPIVILYELQGCPHCTAIEQPWANAMSMLKANNEVSDCVDCANAVYYYDKGVKPKNPRSRLDHLPEQLRGINGFPTIQILHKGSVVEEYNGDRSQSSIVEFVTGFVRKHPELKKVKPVKPKKPTATKKKPVQKT